MRDRQMPYRAEEDPNVLVPALILASPMLLLIGLGIYWLVQAW